MQAYVVILLIFGLFFLIEVISIMRLVVQYLPPVRRLKISFRINIIIFITGCLMLAVVLLFDVNYLHYKSPMPYAQWKSITFSDFRGLKRPGQTLDGMSEFAFIVPQMKVSGSGKSIEVQTYFHPCRSYVYNTAIQDEKLLKHELYHLHITEYTSRLLRKQLKEAKQPVSDEDLEAFIRAIRNKER
ncbi:MAG TPA: hypothetical protein VNZ86_18870, partial [Bacteroidia bacterium]|nr:hypothetical protein [Bacteroidia bacterium]